MRPIDAESNPDILRDSFPLDALDVDASSLHASTTALSSLEDLRLFNFSFIHPTDAPPWSWMEASMAPDSMMIDQVDYPIENSTVSKKSHGATLQQPSLSPISSATTDPSAFSGLIPGAPTNLTATAS
ncbi:MAG: hypothetical protein OXF06_05990, partial [Bacteroidetes bacterium]|nr:hypothetical protein [Bacteroidota bacterium]